MIAAVILLVKIAHIGSGAAMIVGIAGRELMRACARRAVDIAGLARWVRRSGWFERWLAIPGSQVVLVAGLLLAWLRGWPVLGFLQGAHSNWLLAALVLYLLAVPLIVLIFIPRGKVFERRLAAAVAQGQITGELRASFGDRVVHAAHVAEALVIAAVVYLMVTEPF
jgi:uncharacterized membrane protein